MMEQPGHEVPKWPLDRQIEFHLREFEQLKAEIGQLDSAKRKLQIYSCTAVAILISWLAANKTTIDTDAPWAWWLPLLSTAMGWLLSRAYVHTSRKIGAYLKRIEQMGAYRDLGWETHYQRFVDRQPDSRTFKENIAWGLLTAVSVVIGFSYGIPD